MVLRICVVGTGFSGILAGIKLKTKLKGHDFTIFEDNCDIGGTWLTNTYPGCASDVPSYLYSYSFEQRSDWTHTYSSQEAILQYLKDVANKYDLRNHIKFNTRVEKLFWDSKTNAWIATVYDKLTKKVSTVAFDIVINCTGALRKPNTPKDFEDFRGQIIHTGLWDPSIDLRHKIVGVVGSGASAVQLIPAIAPIVKKLYNFQRNPALVIPRSIFQYPEFVKRVFKMFPSTLGIFRVLLFQCHECTAAVFPYPSVWNKVGLWIFMNHLKKQVLDKNLVKELTPSYPFCAKRVTVSNEYYKAFGLPNVQLHKSPIKRIEGKTALLEDGEEVKLEVLILATGYEAQDFFGSIEIIGKNGLSLNDYCKQDRPYSLYGITLPNTPNFFMMLGPNTYTAHNSIVFMLECQIGYIIKVIGEMINRDAVSVEVNMASCQRYMTKLDKRLEKTVWRTGLCDSWYKNSNGSATAIWPWSCRRYWWKTRNIKFTDFKFFSNTL